MSVMERSLRRALDNGDASDPAFREAIYSASERALERMLADKGTPEADAHAQRVRLAETINSVEDDYFQAAEAAVAPHEFDDAQPEEPETPSGLVETGQGGTSDFLALQDSAYDAVPAGPADESPGTDAGWSPGARKLEKLRTKRRLSPAAIALVVVCLLVLACIWFIYRAIFETFDQTSSASGPAIHAVDVRPTMSPGDWITVFDGTRLDAISNPEGGQLQAFGGVDGREPAVRLTSAGDGTGMSVAVGPGLFGRLKGRKVRVEIVAGTPDGSAREFSVRCMFGRQTACARLTFTTDRPSEPFLFEMTVLGNAARSGSITILPGFGAARDLDLYRVRLHPIDTI